MPRSEFLGGRQFEPATENGNPNTDLIDVGMAPEGSGHPTTTVGNQGPDLTRLGKSNMDQQGVIVQGRQAVLVEEEGVGSKVPRRTGGSSTIAVNSQISSQTPDTNPITNHMTVEKGPTIGCLQ